MMDRFISFYYDGPVGWSDVIGDKKIVVVKGLSFWMFEVVYIQVVIAQI